MGVHVAKLLHKNSKQSVVGLIIPGLPTCAGIEGLGTRLWLGELPFLDSVVLVIIVFAEGCMYFLNL